MDDKIFRDHLLPNNHQNIVLKRLQQVGDGSKKSSAISTCKDIQKMITQVLYNWRRILSWFEEEIFRRTFLNAGKLLSAQGFSAALTFVVMVLTARALGPEKYGILALVFVYVTTIGVLVTFNAWQAIIKFGGEAIQVGDRVGLRQLIKFGFSLDVGSAIFGTILAVTLSGPVISLLGWDQAVRPLLVLYSWLILFSFSGTPTGILRLFDRFDLLSYTTVLSALVRFGGLAYCLSTRQSLTGFVLIYLVTGIVGQLSLVFASLQILRKQGLGDFILQPFQGLRARFPGVWDYVWTTNVNSTIRVISRESDGLIIAGLTTPANLGLFKIAKQFSLILPALLDPLYQSIYPELARLWASGKKQTLVSLIKRTTLMVSGVAVSGWIGFIVLGHWLIAITVGPAYSSVYLLTVIYMLALVIALCTFSFTPWMLAMGLPKRSFIALIVSTGIYLVLLLIFVRYLGIAGASISYVGFYLVWAGIMLVYLRPYMSKA